MDISILNKDKESTQSKNGEYIFQSDFMELKTQQKGKVTQTTGSWYAVLLENGNTVQCRLRGKLKLQDLDTTNPVAVGDFVLLENTLEDGEFVITDILERQNYIIRQSPRKEHQRHIIASNIDQFFIVATISQPRTSLGFVDRCIAAAECYHIPVHIIINKKDLLRKKDIEKLKEWQQIYHSIAYPIHVISANDKADIEMLKNILKDKTTLISGHSGVGKSTILNAVNGDLRLKTGKISSKWKKGMHTTTFATLYSIFENTFVIDTPGIKEFSILHVEPEEVSGYFVDIKEHAKSCKFNNCMHINEPDCAVLSALDDGRLAPTRYENYLNIVENIKEINYWERK